MNDSPNVKAELSGAVGILTLDRQKALNALSLEMIRTLHGHLEEWAQDPGVGAILLKGAGDRAFCAGADVRSLFDAGKKGEPLTRDFFWHEYRLDRLIFRYPKPLISLWDGIAMGGGLGISATGEFRVATQRTRAAMPESGIGLFPDAGGTHFLSQLPGMRGLYLGMTGVHLDAADALAVGLATHVVHAEAWSGVEKALGNLNAQDLTRDAIAQILEDRAFEPGPSKLAEDFAEIDALFSADALPSIIDGLVSANTSFSKKTLAHLQTLSPTSVAYAFEANRKGRGMSFEEIMKMEFRVSQACMAGPDFFEGIRALLVDKDKNPRWDPPTFNELTTESIEAAFAPLASADELHFD
jgi:enoyl-CoA hydratase/carnithine racemase